MNEVTGGCLCGQVRYTTKSPKRTGVCHCKNCQRQSGSAFSVNILMKASDLDLRGDTKIFHDRGDSGRAVDRHFCADCGSPIFTLLPTYPELVILKAGTLDDISGLPQPTLQSYCKSAQAWVELPNVEKKFEGMPS